MTMSLRLRAVPLLALITACAESTAPSDPGGPGTVTFTYDGALISGGTFTATGPLRATDPAERQQQMTWTTARRVVGHGAISIEAQLVTDNEKHYALIYTYPDPSGSSRINLDCGTGPINCTHVVWSVDDRKLNVMLQNCGLGSGTVTITQLTATRVRGTFSGTGMCFRPTQGSFTVSSGEFDVPRSPDTPG
jgi:hypothetical protein